MGLRGNKKSEEEKMREQAAIQDSVNTGGLEQQAMQQKQKDKKEGSNYLFDVEEARALIEKGLKGKETRLVNYRDKQTGNIEQQTVEIDKRQRKLCNDDAAELYLSIAENGALNHNTISGYLPASQIKKKVLGTMGPVFDQVIFNHHLHGIGYKNTQDASSVISIVRNPLIDGMNKARGGRMIESQEKVRVEKESISREGGENQENDSGLRSLF
jgi:hypothetical protein